MILGIGIDVCLASRFASLHQKHGPRILERIFHENELRLAPQLSSKPVSDSTPYYYQYFASRWAVKEAFIKALGQGSIGSKCIWVEKSARDAAREEEGLGMKNASLIGLSPYQNSRPIILLEDRVWTLLEHRMQVNRDDVRLWCSLSHDGDYCIGQVIIETV